MKIDELDLSVRAYNCLIRAGIDTVEKLMELSDDDLARIRNLSQRNIDEIRSKVAGRRQTNADRIRAMNDEELADFLCSIAYTGNDPWSEPFCRAFCDKCPTIKGTYVDTGIEDEFHECDFSDGKCPHGSDCVWWLQKPAEAAK